MIQLQSLTFILSLLFSVQAQRISRISPQYGSIAGGTTVNIYGSGFATDSYTSANIVYFDDIPCIVEWYRVSPTMMSCVTEPHPGAYEGFNSQWLQANLNGERVSSGYAKFIYHWHFTPRTMSVIPTSGPIGSLIEIGGFRFRSDIFNNYKYFFLGEQICDPWNDNINDYYGGRWSSGLYHIKCLIKERTPGAWNATAIMTTDRLGMTWNHSTAMKLGFDGKLSMFELYPEIDGIHPSSGGIKGGTLLKITGTGFGIATSTLTIDIDGIPCEVVKHTPEEINCWTQPPPLGSKVIVDDSQGYSAVEDGYRFIGSRGVTVHKFDGLPYYNVEDLYNDLSFPDYPDQYATFPSFSPENIYNDDRYGSRYMAFFSPVQSGLHTFFARADDTAHIYLHEGNNITKIESIAQVTSRTGWYSNTGDFSNRRSSPLNLTEGQHYLIVGDLAEGYGGDYLRVGVLMHETSFYYNETVQSVRERQEIRFSSYGHYDIQSITLQVNTSLVDPDEPPEFVLSWGNRSRNILLSELIDKDDIVTAAAYSLLEGVCQFEPSFGVYHFNNTIYDFETGVQGWQPWDSTSPEVVEDEALCGRQSLYLQEGRALGFDLSSQQGFDSSIHPFLCMAYKIPNDVQVGVVIRIDGIGWRTIAMTTGSNEFSYELLTDWRNDVTSDEIINDDTWRYGCAGVHNLLAGFLNSDELYYKITGFGFYSPEDPLNRGFHIDQASFSSEKKTLDLMTYLPPARPNEISIHELLNTTQKSKDETESLFSINVTMEIIPTSCDHELPLIEFYPANESDPSILNYNSEKLRNASAPVAGTYTLGFNDNWTEDIEVHADVEEIKRALESLPGVNLTTVWYSSQVLPQDKLGKYCPGRTYWIRFDNNPGDLPLLEIDTSNLTGHGLNVEVKEVETGGLFLYPIPGHMLQTVEETPQVHLRISGQLAACSGRLDPYEYTYDYTNPCGFTFNASLTPNVTSISPMIAANGDLITIYGSGFSTVNENNFVLFGEVQCMVATTSDSSISCVLSDGQAGVKKLWLHVLSMGAAETNDITLEYKVTVDSIDPITCGTEGGVDVIITGDGFVDNDNHPDTSGIGYTYSQYKTATASNCNLWKTKVLIGSNECVLTDYSRTSIKCIAPDGIDGTTDIIVTIYCDDVDTSEEYNGMLSGGFTYNSSLSPNVTTISPVSGSGIATGDDIQYDYVLEVTSVSKCNGSLFGGHTLVIEGNGFGDNKTGINVMIGDTQCTVDSVTDSQIECTTKSTTITHQVTNNAYNAEYGLGYSWDPAELSIHVGDTVKWKWTGSPFTPRKRIVQVDSEWSNEYNGYGFTSDVAITGSFTHTFIHSGVYYYIMEGYGEIGFRGFVNVTSFSLISSPLSVIIDSIPVSFTASDICNQTLNDSLPQYSFSIDETPHILSVTPSDVEQGDTIQVTVSGIMNIKDYNILTIGGKPCTESNHTSINNSFPISDVPDEFEYISAVVDCTVPDVYPGDYRIVLHTAGRGWAFGKLNDTRISVKSSITDIVSVVLGSLRGGVLLSIPIRGIHSNLIGHTTVHIGNTPCPIQRIEDIGTTPQIGNIICKTRAIAGDGYSSFVRSTALAYWSLQADFYDGSGYLDGSESSELFSSYGLMGNSTPAVIMGIVTQRHSGISGNNYTDQSAYFDSAYIRVSSFQQYHDLKSFSFEFWMKSFSPVGKYVILASSYESSEDITSGFILMLNPCNQIEYWLSTGESISDTSEVDDDCELVHTGSDCTTLCDNGRIVQSTNDSFQYQIPIGVWSIVRSSNISEGDSDWVHVVFGFEADESKNNNPFNCITNSMAEKCTGLQVLYLNSNQFETNTTYQHTTSSNIEFGGSSALPIGINPNSLVHNSQLYPYIGYIDEISLFDHMITGEDVINHYHYGTTEEQPIWIRTEYNDGIGNGMVPNLEFTQLETVFDDIVLNINLNDVRNGEYTVPKRKGIEFYWTGFHGLWQVSHSTFEACSKSDDIPKEWASPQNNGSLQVWLESGQTYYFIDPVGDNCIDGIKVKIHIGDVTEINWQIGEHPDITITDGSGLLFKWSGFVPHNIIEMTSRESVSSTCKFVGENANDIGKVVKEWHSTPSADGEVAMNGLSVGEHYIVCSVGSHCKLGMRFTVTVVPEDGKNNFIEDTDEATVYTIPWYVRTYEPLTVVEGEEVLFAWDGFHSLYQVTEEVYDSCNTAAIPLQVWGDPSVDNSVTLEDLSPGTYYFICSVSGHCDAGMKIKITVLSDDEIPVLQKPVAANCGTKSGLCSFAYSTSVTPVIMSFESDDFLGDSEVKVNISNHDYSSYSLGDTITDTTILIGQSPCTNVRLYNITDMHTELECTVKDQESGFYPFSVHIEGVGYAMVSGSVPLIADSTEIEVFLAAVVNNISPNQGSLAGGTYITIDGTGFSYILDNVEVILGEYICKVVAATGKSITCISSAVTSDLSVPLIVNINGYPASSNLMFEYTTDLTPIITSLSPSSDLIGEESITITGEKFDNDINNTAVQILKSEEDFDFGDDMSVVDCTVTSVSLTSIECTMPFRGAGSYMVVVHVTGKGLSREETEGDSVVTYQLMVDDFTPSESGHGGGVVLNITGVGFPTGHFTGLEVVVCEVACIVTGVISHNELACILDPSNTETPFQSDTPCYITVNYNSVSASSVDTFTFKASLTPSIDYLTPNVGGTAGGTYITINGSSFYPSDEDGTLLDQDDIVVTIDTAVCEWYNKGSVLPPDNTSIMCRTSDHQTTVIANVNVFVRGKGYAIVTNDSIYFRYVDRWSSKYTWGGLDPPFEGESVYIKTGQTVFLDIDTPVLNLILIEGELIFEDEQDVHLQAKYIFINNGRLQIGTEEEPFCHKAVITLHGRVRDPEIPIYGAKVIGIRQGDLDFHGKPRNVTWTRLAETAMKNSSEIVVQEPVDWIPGDSIVIAPTGKNGNETETNTIDSVSSDGLTITLATPVSYTHYGITETFEDGQFIEIRAEVGLLSHNVIIQGSVQDYEEFDGRGADQYGAQIMIHRTGPHPTPIRIEHTEVRFAGQAFRLGRYAIHFHLSADMNGSYIRNCAIHHSNNRALTAHGVHNLLVEGNIAYDIKGHAFFVEDGIETNNRYIRNFGVYIRASSSLLNTDQIPAVFWITNPQNVFIGNAAVASRAYGFWYDLDNFPVGPSFTYSVCPNKMPFGEFANNVAHSCNEFGLRIWETYIPYVDGCGKSELGEAIMYNFTSYANGIHGLEFSVVGNIKIIGFKLADNRDNGIEIQETLGVWGGAVIQDSLVISYTSVNDGEPGTGGIKTPNTPRLTISNVTFANFNFPNTACLRACSHCKVLQGGFQVWFEKMKFLGNSSLHKTSFQWEHEVLYHDLDGSLSGEVGGWVTPNSNLHPPQYCSKSVPQFSVNTAVPGTVCTSDVYLLRMAWNNAQPLVTLEDVAVNVTNEFGSSIIPWRHYRLTHTDGYMLILPSTYDHSLIWMLPIEHNVDTMSYSAGMYSMRPEDYVILSHEFVQYPDHVSVGGNHYPTDDNEMVDITDSTFSWYMDNITETVSYIINGINSTETLFDQTWTYTYEACPLTGCPDPVDPDSGPLETDQRRWSDPDSWPTMELPKEGEDVAIASSWRMLLDISPPPLSRVFVYGELEFEDERDYNFTANLILIRGSNAHLIIGTQESPFAHTATITLTGNRNDNPLFLSSSVLLGSKAIGIFGNVTMFGQPKTHTWTRLNTTSNPGDTQIQLKGNTYPNWTPGEEIVIASSSYEPSEAEIRTIITYDSQTGIITFDEPLEYTHKVQQMATDVEIEHWKSKSMSNPWWGGDVDSLTIAPEVGLLSHNIIIQGGEDELEPLEYNHYGCRILIGQYSSTLGFVYNGFVTIDLAEIRYCGQGGYFSPRDPRYSIAFKNLFESASGSRITRSSIHHGYNAGIGVHASTGIEITDNVVHRTTGSSIIIGGNDNTVTGNLALLTSSVQPNAPKDNHAVDFPATYDIDRGNIVKNNAAGGSNRIAYRYTGEPCEENRSPKIGNEAMFWNNTAHSGLIALVLLGLPVDCASVGGLTATHHWDYTIFSSSASSIAITNMKLAVGKTGLNLNLFGPDPVAHRLGRKSITINNTLLVGFLPGETCQTSKPSFAVPGVSFSKSDPVVGVMMSSFNKKRSKMDGTGKWHLMKGYPTVDGEVVSTGITLAHFKAPNDCTYNAFTITNNPISPDAVHPFQMNEVIKLDVPQENLVYFYDPNPDWIVQEDCIDMDCDGPKHALVRDNDGSFGGTAPIIGSIVPFAELRFDKSRVPVTWLDVEGGDDGTATPDEVVDHRGIYRANPLIFTPEGGCKWMTEWNAYHCEGIQHRMLVIESLDADSETRRVSPIALVGSNNTWEYTDLLNGPMDHGWCTYYTCLKRLSTFFTIVSTSTEYHIWMTGSLPSTIRLHLLNSDDNDIVRLHIWYKDPKRKDIYKNGVFIEPKNTQFLDNGAVTQLDGDHTPDYTDISGANYFERNTQLLHMVLRGSTPIEIRTPPVLQVSLDVVVTLDTFFISNLIQNLAFVLHIEPSRIRVVEIIAEDSLKRRSLLATDTMNTVTLEFGDPPSMNIDPPEVTLVEDDWMENEGASDSVDIEAKEESSVASENPFNEDSPGSAEEFAVIYNESAVIFNEELKLFEESVEKVNEVNKIGNQLVQLIQTGDPNLKNASIVAISVIPASSPAVPIVPVIPPEFENITEDSNIIITMVEEPIIEEEEPTGGVNNGVLKFTIPSELTVSMEPHEKTGHLVHVAVSMLDVDGNIVTNLGFLTPWTCTASLINENTKNTPMLEGKIQITFKDGIAEFTRLRVDKPASNLRLMFITSPGDFITQTSVSFNVIEPPSDIPRQEIVFSLEGDTNILLMLEEESIVDHIISSLGNQLDIDVSRIQQVTYDVESERELVIHLTILDHMPTDPPDVPTLNETITTLLEYVENRNLTIVINGSLFTALPGTVDVMDPTQTPLNNPLMIIIGISLGCSSIIALMMIIACAFYCSDKRKKSIKRRAKDQNTPQRFDYRGEGNDTESLASFNLMQMPRARLTTGTPHHPNMTDNTITSETCQTSLTTNLRATDLEEYWSTSVTHQPNMRSDVTDCWDFPTPPERPRLPHPFSQTPSAIQRTQATTLSNSTNTRWS